MTSSLLSVGNAHSCAIDNAGEMTCWGDASDGRTAVPAGNWAAVSAGVAFTCGLSTIGLVTCWGLDDFDQTGAALKQGPISSYFTDEYSSISAGSRHVCGVTRTGRIQCWGMCPQRSCKEVMGCANKMPKVWKEGTKYPGLDVNPFPARVWREVAVAKFKLQWGGYYYLNDYSNYATMEYVETSYPTCALDSQGGLFCWSIRGYIGDTDIYYQTIRMCFVDNWHTEPNGLRFSGRTSFTIESHAAGPTLPAPLAWASISMGYDHMCGIDSGGTLHCWMWQGDDADGKTTVPALPGSATWTRAGLGDKHTCALDSNARLWCWGFNGDGQAAVPGGTTSKWLAVAVGAFHTCATASSGNATGCQ